MSADREAESAAVGPYRLLELLQTLPYASVHRAVRDGIDRPVLLWLFREPYASAAGFAEALEQLAGDPRTRAVPGLLTVEEVGTVPETEPLAFVVTRDAPGGFLVPALEARRAPGVFATATALGATLDAAHALGLVHGDVQPSTVVLEAEGRPALVGLAIRTVVVRVSSDADRSASAAAFRPPERPGESEPDAAADRYGLAALVFYLLCGHSPTEGDELLPPSRWRSGVPPRVDEVVMRALSRNPADRFASASLFTAALTGSPLTVPVPASPVAAPPPPVAAAEVHAEVAVTPTPVGRRDPGAITPRPPAAAPYAAPAPPAPPPPTAAALPAAALPAAAAHSHPSREGLTPTPLGSAPAAPADPARDQERRGRSVWLAVGIALVVGVVAAAAAVIYLLGHGAAHGVR